MAASEAKDQIGFSMGRRFAQTGRKYAFLGRRADRFGIVLFIFFCSAAFGRYGLHTDCHSGMKIDKSRCFSAKQAVRCFSAVEPRVVYSINELFSATN